MAENRLINKDNIEEMRKKFFSPVAKPAPNQRRQALGALPDGRFSPDYDRGKSESTSYLAQAVDVIKGMPTGSGSFRGKAGKARSQTRQIKQARMLSELFSGAGLEDMKQMGQTSRVGLHGETLRDLQTGRQSFTANQAAQTRRDTLSDKGLARNQLMQDQLFKTLTAPQGLSDSDWIKYNTAASDAFTNAMNRGEVLKGEDIRTFTERTNKSLAGRLYGDGGQSIGGAGLQAINQGREGQTYFPEGRGVVSRSDCSGFSLSQMPTKISLDSSNYLQAGKAIERGSSNLKNIGENAPEYIDPVTGVPKISLLEAGRRIATDTEEIRRARMAEEAAITKKYQER